jgi:hypothetical protein
MNQILHRTPTEIQKAGWEALKKQLGLPGALRFLLQYERGEGDYTKLRKKYFKGKTVKSLVNDMRKERKI